LDDEAVATLVAALTGMRPDRAAARGLSERTAGNPFFVRELTQHAVETAERMPLPDGVLDIVAARVAGAHWLDDWAREWRRVALEIDGTDLLERGVAQGPALGRGLGAALRAKLDGETLGRDDELRVALGAAS